MKQHRYEGTARWVRTCYGLDLHDDRVIVVRAVRTGGRLSLKTIDENDASFRSDLLKRDSVTVGCLRERESFARWLTAPFASVSKARQVFPSLLDIQLPFPLEECVYEILAEGATDEPTVSALAVGARFSDMQRRLQAYAERRMDPALLDQEGLALWTQSIREKPVAPNAMRAVVFLRGHRATVVTGRNGLPSGSHSIPAGAADIDRILRARLGGQSVTVEWAWAGDDASGDRANEIRRALRETWPGMSFIHDEPESLLARAIATRALAPGPLRCNLRTGQFQHDLLTRREERSSGRSALLVLTAGLVLCIAGLASDSLARRRLRNAISSFESQVNRLAGAEVRAKGERAIEQVEKSLKTNSRLRQPFVDAMGTSLSQTLKTIVDTGNESQLSYEFMTIRSDFLTITGISPSWDRCELLKGRLDTLGVPVKLERRKSLGDGKIRFSVTPERAK